MSWSRTWCIRSFIPDQYTLCYRCNSKKERIKWNWQASEGKESTDQQTYQHGETRPCCLPAQHHVRLPTRHRAVHIHRIEGSLTHPMDLVRSAVFLVQLPVRTHTHTLSSPRHVQRPPLHQYAGWDVTRFNRPLTPGTEFWRGLWSTMLVTSQPPVEGWRVTHSRFVLTGEPSTSAFLSGSGPLAPPLWLSTYWYGHSWRREPPGTSPSLSPLRSASLLDSLPGRIPPMCSVEDNVRKPWEENNNCGVGC
ncbi:hypothetical protein VTK73DRAFT_8795 [Phialemonium thermophilum]|uniref:Uncharacterized protein n=1 Tax=Phialemonium thermophilum TaxID=223376 RepID=A0ABR3W684_9PEZI